MDSNVQPLAWKRYLITCESLGYHPEATVETNLLQRYKTLYTRCCQDNGLQFNPSTNSDSNVDQEKLSELLYLNLCEELGYESIIQIRRNITNLMDQVHNQIDSDKECLIYQVGSKAEGLRMITSDIDSMTVCTANLTVNNSAEIPELSCGKRVVIMETDNTEAGYVRLQLVTDKYMTNERMSSSGRNYDDKHYLQSALCRNLTISSIGKNVEAHGPAATMKGASMEYDFVHCYSCTSQPIAVQVWEERCKEYNWPDSVVLEQCISFGCQLAPVGFPESPYERIEWRISFILMEKTLLQSLPHSWFMCYGLLKVYLKEVLDPIKEINGLVSSYFMKTVLLWEIQISREHNIGADGLLQVFRKCLQRLRTCVEKKKCPNFFIPENNMFKNKIDDNSLCTLQNILESLLKENFYGLYRCQSIDLPHLIFQVLINEKKSVVVSVNESIYVTKEDIEANTWLEINELFAFFQYSLGCIEDLYTLLKTMELMQTKDSLTDLENRAVQTWISHVTILITTHKFKDIIAPNVSPDIKLEKYNSCCNIFRAHDCKGSLAQVYLATLMYITTKYDLCLKLISECIGRFEEGFIDLMQVSVYLELTELRLELELSFHKDILGIERAFLQIEPKVYLSMLSVVCHYHLKDVNGAEKEFEHLREIRSGMKTLRGEEMYWQVLGICAEIIGKYDEAYQSYMRAYKTPRNCLEDNAPLLRVLCLIYKRLQEKY